MGTERAAAKPAGRAISARTLGPVVFAACSLPVVKVALDAARGALGANPIEAALNRFGFWALFFLVASLLSSPAKVLLGVTAPLRYRRMVGLFAFFYAALHLSTYAGLDQGLDLGDIGRDIVERKFIAVGFLAFLLLVPLAATSTDGAVKRLGFRRWKGLHRLAYAAAVLGVVHFVWRVKADLLEPAVFGVVLAASFAARFVARRPRRPV